MPIGQSHTFQLLDNVDFVRKEPNFGLNLTYPASDLYSLGLYGRNYPLDEDY
jgi:hypothetical protein